MENVSALCGLIPVECFVKMFGCCAASGIAIVMGTNSACGCFFFSPLCSVSLSLLSGHLGHAGILQQQNQEVLPLTQNQQNGPDRWNVSPLYLFHYLFENRLTYPSAKDRPNETVWQVGGPELKGNWAKHMSHSGFLPGKSRLEASYGCQRERYGCVSYANCPMASSSACSHV